LYVNDYFPKEAKSFFLPQVLQKSKLNSITIHKSSSYYNIKTKMNHERL